METPFGLMQVTSAPMRVSEASMTASDYMAGIRRDEAALAQPNTGRTIQRK
jgi:hypothetical protein